MALGVAFEVGIKEEGELAKQRMKGRHSRQRDGMIKGSEAHCLEWPVTE